MKRWIALAGILALGPAFAEEPSVDEIIEQNIQARGGDESWQAIESAYMTGTMLMGGGMEAPFRIWFKRPEKVRMEFDVQGMTGVQAYDGETGWFVMPFMGKTEAEEMAEDQLKDIKETADFDGPLMGYEEKGHQVELEGVEDVEGTEAYKLKLTKANGDVSYIYLDKDYFLEFKQTAKTERQGNEIVIHTTLGDYKEVGDVIMPHSMQMEFEGMPVTQAITIEAVDLNVEIPDDKFDMPEPAADAANAE